MKSVLCTALATLLSSGVVASCGSSSIPEGENTDAIGRDAGDGGQAGSGGAGGAPVMTMDGASNVSCATNGTLSWRARSRLPHARFEVGAAVVKGRIYAIGGSDAANTTAELDEYDPGTDTWTSKRPMPTARQNAVVGVVGDKIYVTAGYAYTDPNNVTYFKATEVYDPATDAWVTKAPIPAPDASKVLANLYLGGAALGDKIYVVVSVYSTNSNTLVYDTVNDSWSTAAPIPLLPSKPAAATMGDLLYVVPLQIPGVGYETRIATFDPAAPGWMVHPGPPTQREAPTAGVWAGALFVTGGWAWTFGTSNPAIPVNVVEAFDPPSSSWRALSNLPTARALAATASTGEGLYVIGGATGRASTPLPSDVVEEATCLP